MYSVILAVGILAVILPSQAVSEEEIRIGDDIAAVKALLGDPKGYMKTTSFQLFFYDRGRVEFREDKVSMVNIVSEEEATAQKALEAEGKQRERELASTRRERRLVEGENIKAMKLSDPDFINGNYDGQVAFWKTFRTRYPGVAVDNEYREALTELEKGIVEEQAWVETAEREARLQERVAGLEKRLADAEKRTRRAEEYQRRQNTYRAVYTTPYVYHYTPYSSYITTPTFSTGTALSITAGSSPGIRFRMGRNYVNYGHGSLRSLSSHHGYRQCSSPSTDFSRFYASISHRASHIGRMTW